MDDNDFYEEDEPIEKIRADYAAGEPGVTVPKRTRKSEDFVQRMKRVVEESTAEKTEPVVTRPFDYDDEGAFVSTSAPHLIAEENIQSSSEVTLPVAV